MFRGEALRQSGFRKNRNRIRSLLSILQYHGIMPHGVEARYNPPCGVYLKLHVFRHSRSTVA